MTRKRHIKDSKGNAVDRVAQFRRVITERPIKAARLEARVTPGQEHPRNGNVRESDTVGQRWTFLRAVHDAGAGRGRVRGGAEFSTTITAPVMKGLRGGEEKVHRVAIIVHCMLQRISKYSQKVCVY